MAVDITFETFSRNFFRYMRPFIYKINASDAVKQYEQYEDEMFPSFIFCLQIFPAVDKRLCMHYFYNNKYFNENYRQFSEYNTDFYVFLQKTFYCRRYAQHLNIFDQFLTVCEIAIIMDYTFFYHNNLINMDLAICNCAMFLDTEIKDKFYDAGGWIQLKNYSLTYENLLEGVSLGNDDLQNAIDMFLAASTNYDMEMLMSYFQRIVSRYNEHIKNMYCSKCSLLFPAVKYIAFSENNSDDEIDIIEGLFQMVFIIKSFERVDDIMNCSEKATKTLTSAENSDCINSNKEAMENEKYIFESRPFKASSSEITLNLLSEMFGENKFKTQEFDFCSLCLKSLCKSPEYLKKNVETSERNCTKINILSEIKYFNVKDCSPTSPESKASEFKSVSEHALQKSINSEPISTLTDSAPRKLSSSVQAASREDIPDTESLKDLLKLFIGLGIEPVRTEILSDLKQKYKESSKVKFRIEKKDNLQNTCILPNSITNQEALKENHKAKKKRNRKKKNVNFNKSVV